MKLEMTRDQRLLATPRLFLRPFEPEDLVPYRELYIDPEQTRLLPGGPYPPEAGARRAKQAVTAFMDHWRARGFGPWAVLTQEERELIGHAGLRWLPEPGQIELLAHLRKDLWRRGLAFEALSAGLGWARRFLPPRERLVAGIHPEDLGGRRLLIKLGFREEAPALVEAQRVLMFAATLIDLPDAALPRAGPPGAGPSEA